MKIILLITSCVQNANRVKQQLNNLKHAKLHNLIPSDIEITPIFVFGNGSSPNDLDESELFNPLVVPVIERYENLYLKLFRAYEHIDSHYKYDFIWKIDDDTLINFQHLNSEMLKGKDYVGRFFGGNADMKIRIDLEFCNLHKDILFKPPFFDTKKFQFATGDSYFLSPRAIAWIRQQRPLLAECEGHRINEDRLFGYMLNDKDLVTEDINLMDDFIVENSLQVTRNYLTIHPISTFLFSSLIGYSPEDQLHKIDVGRSVNLLRRRAYTADLEAQIKQVVYDFINSKKSIGMG